MSRMIGNMVMFNFHTSFRSKSIKSLVNRMVASRSSSSKAVDDAPVPYIGSDAYKWKAEYTRRGPDTDTLWYQPYVVSLSTAIFMIYFCFLREESDIDIKLGSQQLLTPIPELERKQLLVLYKYNKENGINNDEISIRLKELDKENGS